MIVVRVEIWPYGDSRDLESVAELTITRIDRLSPGKGMYEVRQGQLRVRFEHQPVDDPWKLVQQALAALDPAGP